MKDAVYLGLVDEAYILSLTLTTRLITDDGARLNCPPLIYYSTAISHHCISVAVSVSMAASYVLCPECDMMEGGVVIGSHISPDTTLPWSRYCSSISPLGWLKMCNVDGLVQHYSSSNALAMELPQSCIKPVMWYHRSNGNLDIDW